MILSESMIWVRPGKEEKRIEWQLKMMSLSKMSNKSLNLVPVLTHTQEEEDNRHEIMDQEEDGVDQNEWLFLKFKKISLKGQKINIHV